MLRQAHRNVVASTPGSFLRMKGSLHGVEASNVVARERLLVLKT